MFLSNFMEVSYGAAASWACILFLYLTGTALKGIHPLIGKYCKADALTCGIAVFIMWSWYSVLMSIPLTRAVNHFALTCTLFVLASVWLWRNNLNVRNIISTVKFPTLLFFIFYFFTYAFLYKWHEPGKLPILYRGNYDVFNYINTEAAAQALNWNPVAGGDLQGVFQAIPGVFELFDALSKFYGDSALLSAFPLLVCVISVSAVLVSLAICKCWNLRSLTAILIAMIGLTGIFFRYICDNYFLSQLIGSVILIAFVWKSAELFLEKKQRSSWLVIVVSCLPYLISLLYTYPALIIISFFAHFILIGADYLTSKHNCINAPLGFRFCVLLIQRLTKKYFWYGSALFVSLSLVAIFDVSHFLSAMRLLLLLSTKGQFGWPLDVVSPAALLGIPSVMELATHSRRIWGWAGFLVCLSSTLCFYRLKAEQSSAVEKCLSLLFASLTCLYVAYYWHVGPSYQQWKFASYTVLPFAFVWWGGAIDSLSRLTANLKAPVQKLAVLMIEVLLPSLVVGANLYLPTAFSQSAFVRYPDKYLTLSSIEKFGNWKDIYLLMRDPATTFLSVFFLPSKTLHLASLSYYYPQEPIDYSKISPNWPLFVADAVCTGTEQVTVADLGCLYFKAPGLRRDRVYKFNSILAEISGLGEPEAWGRWNSADRLTLIVRANDTQLSLLPRGFINLELSPFSYPGSTPQKIKVAVGSRTATQVSIGKIGWYSFAFDRDDWKGGSSKELSIAFEYPNAISPHDVNPKNADGRKLAVGFVSISMTSVANGFIVDGK